MTEPVAHQDLGSRHTRCRQSPVARTANPPCTGLLVDLTEFGRETSIEFLSEAG
jgi:hypothetical protein